METALNMLSDEHKNILNIAGAMQKECEKIEAGKNIDADFFKKAIAFIRNYADKFHHAKEEDILFKELNKSEMHCNPMQQMLYEHDMGRNFIKELESGVKENNRQKVIENAVGYAQLIQEHIFKEDSILYPMADESLSKKAKDAMLSKFNQINKKFAKENKKHLSLLN